MAEIKPGDVKWEILAGAQPAMDWVRRQFGDSYAEQRDGFRQLLSEYFSQGGCDYKSGKTISPIGPGPDGGKVLKVRWSLPGMGARGGLRIIAVVYCEQRRVKLAGVWQRKDDPSDEEVAAAVTKAKPDPQ